MTAAELDTRPPTITGQLIPPPRLEIWRGWVQWFEGAVFGGSRVREMHEMLDEIERLQAVEHKLWDTVSDALMCFLNVADSLRPGTYPHMCGPGPASGVSPLRSKRR